MRRYDIEDCLVKDLTLHSKLEELVRLGVLEERESYQLDTGKSKHLLYKGNRVAVRRRVKGNPDFVVDKSNFDDFHDVAYCPVTGEMLAFAKSL